MNKNKTILLLVGKSGCGKSTIQEKLKNKYNLKPILSYTTRPIRYNGEGGHLFVTDNYFKNLKNLVAYTKFNGYEYGATVDQINDFDTYVVDPSGVDFLKRIYNGDKSIKVVYIQVPAATRFIRMVKRGDGILNALDRIIHDHYMFKNFECDTYIENTDSDLATQDIYNFYK